MAARLIAVASRSEASDDTSLPNALAKALRPVLLRLDRRAGAQDLAKRGLRVLRGFASAFHLGVMGIDVSVKPEDGVADTGDLAVDVPELLQAVGQAAASQATAITLIIHEIQYLAEAELAPSIMAMHRVSQQQLPLVLFGAGLPQVRGQMGEAKSYVERLFDFPAVDALGADDARRAIVEPARSEGVDFMSGALDEIFQVTAGYPHFLQEWGHTVWRRATVSPITQDVVVASHDTVIRHLDASFFRVRLDRMTPTEKRYMRAMAELGTGSHRSGDIVWRAGHQRRADPQHVDLERHHLQPGAWRDRVHRAAVRRIHAARNAGVALTTVCRPASGSVSVSTICCSCAGRCSCPGTRPRRFSTYHFTASRTFSTSRCLAVMP